MTHASRFPFPPLEDDLKLTDPRMVRWMQDVWQQLNSLGLDQPTTLPAVGTSPYTYNYIGAGLASLLINSGTVSLVEFSRDNSTFYSVGAVTDTSYLVNQGDFVRVTYTVAPTLTLIPR